VHIANKQTQVAVFIQKLLLLQFSSFFCVVFPRHQPFVMNSQNHTANHNAPDHNAPNNSARLYDADSAVERAIAEFLPPRISPGEFRALYALLDDSDERVRLAVRQKLKSYGGVIAPCLRSLERREENPLIKQSCAFVVKSFRQDALLEIMDTVKNAAIANADIDLENALGLLSRFGYPETDPDEIGKTLDALALRVHALFMKSQQHNDLGLLMSVNQAFFEEAQFAGAEDEAYHHPDNSYAHALLKTKRGIPISLCALYLLVADRAGVTLYGVGMPAHFVVYSPELDIFIDTFNKGAFLSREDCRKFIKGAGFVFDPSMLERVSNTAILLRMIRNLIFAYSKTSDEWEVAALQEISATIVEMMNQEES
jgi:regulator of sirC expression with transglutaminase-like and TPR domain